MGDYEDSLVGFKSKTELYAEIAELEEFHHQSLKDWQASNRGYESHIERLREAVKHFLDNHGKPNLMLRSQSEDLLNSTPSQSLSVNNTEVIRKFQEEILNVPHGRKKLTTIRTAFHEYNVLKDYASQIEKTSEE